MLLSIWGHSGVEIDNHSTHLLSGAPCMYFIKLSGNYGIVYKNI